MYLRPVVDVGFVVVLVYEIGVFVCFGAALLTLLIGATRRALAPRRHEGQKSR